jgi:polyisoprenoid-binding protein YceI
MKKAILILVLSILSISANAQTTKWSFDEAHSKIGFSVVHMMVSDVDGNFKKYEGEITSDKEDFSDAKINFKVDVSSINTDNDKRDEHLRSADFFNAPKYPTITFVGDKMKKAGKGKYKLTGNFTMLGVTKKVTLDVTNRGMRKDPWGNTKAGFKLTGKVNRNDFGLKYNSVLDGGGVMISDNVDINCNIELLKSKS